VTNFSTALKYAETWTDLPYLQT
jgi:hypothetical protein